MDKQKLIKILNLTQSPNDNEALSAIRMANKIILEAKESWEKLLTITAPKFQDFFYEKRTYTQGPSIEEMLDICLDKVTGEGLDFIESLHEQWTLKKTLSPKQKAALQKFYENCV